MGFIFKTCLLLAIRTVLDVAATLHVKSLGIDMVPASVVPYAVVTGLCLLILSLSACGVVHLKGRALHTVASHDVAMVTAHVSAYGVVSTLLVMTSPSASSPSVYSALPYAILSIVWPDRHHVLHNAVVVLFLAAAIVSSTTLLVGPWASASSLLLVGQLSVLQSLFDRVGWGSVSAPLALTARAVIHVFIAGVIAIITQPPEVIPVASLAHNVLAGVLLFAQEIAVLAVARHCSAHVNAACDTCALSLTTATRWPYCLSGVLGVSGITTAAMAFFVHHSSRRDRTVEQLRMQS